MRRLYIGLVVSATTILFPLWAMASNQEVAEEIAANLREGAQLHHYRIGVKFQDGTAWLKGHVSSQEQIKEVLKVVSETPGVDRVVNKLKVENSAAKESEEPATSKSDLHKSMLTLRVPGGSVAPENISATAGGQHAVAQRYSGKVSSPAQRLQQVVDGKSDPVVQANQVPSSYAPAPAQTVSATEEQPQIIQQRAIPQPLPQQRMMRQQYVRSNRPIPVGYTQPCPPQQLPVEAYTQGQMQGYAGDGGALPINTPMTGGNTGITPARYDHPNCPNYAWPSYAAHPNYAAVTYPRQYSAKCWPYIGPFYPYPQVPLGWRKVTLEWDDGWWMLDFKDTCHDTCR
ncbi:MAG: BON domain-containing protein [Pirellulales bacterium]|nr:BON domain-containing protein [Pirellulales bacterium]